MRWLSMILVTLCIFASVGLSMAATVDVGNEYEHKTIQAGVNAASAGDTVLVHAGIYNIDNSIMAKSNITIKGEGAESIIYTDDFDDIADAENMGMIYCLGVSNVEICDLSFVGPAKDIRDQHENGGISLGGLREARNAIMVRSSENIVIHDIDVKMILSDGVRVERSEDVDIYNARFVSAGHDGVSVFRSNDVDINNCYIDIMINTGIRYYFAYDCAVTNTTFIQSLSGTGAGFIELEHEADGILITKNAFLKSVDPVIWTVYEDGGNITVRDNAVYENEGIRSSYSPFSVVVENNTKYATARNWAEMGYGYNGDVSGLIVDYPDQPKVSDDDDNIEPIQEVTETGNETASITDDGVNYTCDVEPVEVCEDEEFAIENCSNEYIPENCTETNDTNSTAAIDLYKIIKDYLSLSQEDTNVSMSLLQSGNNDTAKAYELLNGTTEEQQLSKQFMKSSEIKLKAAQELLNLSVESLEVAESLNTQNCSTSE